MDDTTIVNVGTEKINALWATVSQYAFAFGIKILAAIAFWVIGRWLIGFAVGMVQKSLERQKVDPTVLRYVGSFITVTLNVLLVVGILGFFGIQTTSLAALIAAVGLAIGMAWSGLLANLAAGGFIIVLRPFKVGDFICAGGVTGTVKEIGLFTTAINTPDNVLTMVGNNKIFGDNIQNFTHNPFRRVELKAQLSGAADYQAAIALLKQRVAAIPNVLGEPPVDVEILEFNLVGPVLAAQMGYLPGTLWIIAGVVLAGAVQDFMVLFISSRRNGRSLGELVREEMGQVAGTIALFGAFLIMIIILAVLALIVVKALADSPWGMFTVLATIPIALFMGVYMRFIRPGRIGEVRDIALPYPRDPLSPEVAEEVRRLRIGR